jgi:hypothetical protein
MTAGSSAPVGSLINSRGKMFSFSLVSFIFLSLNLCLGEEMTSQNVQLAGHCGPPFARL